VGSLEGGEVPWLIFFLHSGPGSCGGTWAPSWFNRCILFRANISVCSLDACALPQCRFPQVHSLLMAVEKSEGLDIIDPLPYLVPYPLVSIKVESPLKCSDLEKCFFP